MDFLKFASISALTPAIEAFEVSLADSTAAMTSSMVLVKPSWEDAMDETVPSSSTDGEVGFVTSSCKADETFSMADCCSSHIFWIRLTDSSASAATCSADAAARFIDDM